MRGLLLSTAIGVLMASGAVAADVALILGNDRYERLGSVSRAADVMSAQDDLESLGFEVFAVRNGRSITLDPTLVDFADAVAGADRVVVVLSGRVVTDGARNWFLGPEADVPNILAVGRTGVSIEGVMTLLAEAPGQALLAIGVEAGTRVEDGWLKSGLGALDVPQGVTVVTGAPRAVGDFVTEALSQPQADVMRRIGDYDLFTHGYVPQSLILMPERADVVGVAVPSNTDSAADEAFWQGVVALDTVESYRSYLVRFPNGTYRTEAEETIAEILAEPNRADRLIEESLTLSRNDRRDVQRNLTTLDYDTRGIDGIFGPGTRRAITNWQQENGFAQTSYLTGNQITRLQAQASRREAEIQAEEERRARELALLDRTYWDETGAQGDEPGLRAYLDRYPEGIFADLAADRLSVFEAERAQAAAAQEAAFWADVVESDTIDAYREYQSLYPQGAHIQEAQDRIRALDAPVDADEAALAQAEDGLRLNLITRRLIEARLASMGLPTGTVDGVFDGETRAAILAYQDRVNLPATGYLNELTLVRLMADAVLTIER